MGLVGSEPQPVDFVQDGHGAGRINEAGVTLSHRYKNLDTGACRPGVNGWDPKKFASDMKIARFVALGMRVQFFQYPRGSGS